jgi:hypothetical protein
MPRASEPRNPGIAVERSDAPLWLYGALAGGIAFFVAVSLVAIMAIYSRSLRGPSDAPRGGFADPRLQIDPTADLAALRTVQERELSSYGWVDRRTGRVRIPISRAIQDVANTGIKDWPGAEK